MSEHTTRKCDNEDCGRLQAETNHWWAIIRTGRGLVVAPGTEFYQSEGHWVPDAEWTVIDVLDVCGEECCTKLVSRFLSERA